MTCTIYILAPMNQFLSIALKTHFESLKVSGKGENYWQCYQAFLNYCDIYGDCDLKDLFNNKLLRQDIVRACVLYYNSSTKAYRKEAVNRFLSAIDLFYKNYIKKMGGIECSALESGCRKGVCKFCPFDIYKLLSSAQSLPFIASPILSSMLFTCLLYI